MSRDDQAAFLAPRHADDHHRGPFRQRLDLRIFQWELRQDRHAELVIAKLDKAVRIERGEFLEGSGPGLIDLEEHHQIGPPMPQVGERRSLVRIAGQHVERDDLQRLARRRGLDHGRRQPVGQQGRSVGNHDQGEAGRGQAALPAGSEGQPGHGRHEPIPAEVAGQVEQPVPATGKTDRRHGHQSESRDQKQPGRTAARCMGCGLLHGPRAYVHRPPAANNGRCLGVPVQAWERSPGPRDAETVLRRQSAARPLDWRGCGLRMSSLVVFS